LPYEFICSMRVVRKRRFIFEGTEEQKALFRR
jgi:hypothetical protein